VPAQTKRQIKPPKKLEDYITILTAGEKSLEEKHVPTIHMEG
jgi:hypothetical protein